MDKYSVYGSRGFVGSEVCKNPFFIPVEVTRDDRSKLISPTNKLVYLRSTVHNYHVTDNDPYTDIKTNLIHLMSVLQANRIKYGNNFEITWVGTWFSYGTVELPARETSACSPKGFYGISKLCAEQLLASYCNTFGITYKIIRLSNVLGVGDKKVSKRKNAIQYMISELVAGREIELYDGDIIRDFLHVSDAAEAIRKVARLGESGELYNAGSGHPTFIKDIIYHAAKKLNCEDKITTKPIPDFHSKVQAKNMWLDTTKISEELGWMPVRETMDIIDELVEGTYAEQG